MFVFRKDKHSTKIIAYQIHIFQLLIESDFIIYLKFAGVSLYHLSNHFLVLVLDYLISIITLMDYCMLLISTGSLSVIHYSLYLNLLCFYQINLILPDPCIYLVSLIEPDLKICIHSGVFSFKFLQNSNFLDFRCPEFFTSQLNLISKLNFTTI